MDRHMPPKFQTTLDNRNPLVCDGRSHAVHDPFGLSASALD